MKVNNCPKCGREPVSVRVYAGLFFCGWCIECLACKLNTSFCKTEYEAVTKWNELTKGVNK